MRSGRACEIRTWCPTDQHLVRARAMLDAFLGMDHESTPIPVAESASNSGGIEDFLGGVDVDELDARVDEDAQIYLYDAASSAAAPPRKRQKRLGTEGARWADRLKKPTIMADLESGCSCGCVDHLTFAQVLKQRTARYEETAQGRREYMRQYLEHNPEPSTRLGFRLHDDNGRQLCVVGFDILNGFSVGFTHRYIRLHKAGVVADDPGLGGDRRGLSSSERMAGEAFQDDSAASMAFRGWWEELRKDTEIMPNLQNSKERQLDYIEIGELFEECKQDLKESGTAEEAIGGQVSSRATVHPPPPHPRALATHCPASVRARLQPRWPCDISPSAPPTSNLPNAALPPTTKLFC